MAMEICSAGPLTTVQDMGRTGFAARGFQENGACDKYAMRVANLLAGNRADPDRAAVLEFTLRGAVIRFHADAVISLTGADMSPAVNGTPVEPYHPVLIQKGETLQMGTAVRGLRGYLAVYGGISVPEVMGSRSTNLQCHIGGYEGRALRNGDLLPIGKSSFPARMYWRRVSKKLSGWGTGEEDIWLRGKARPWRFLGGERIPLLRVVPGPQAEAFTEEGLRTFEEAVFMVTTDSNRMACKLDGPEIRTIHGSDILSDAIVEGSVQVSSNGKPIVMMADHQTAGGYAKIGTVIRVDLPSMAQARPGDRVAFRFVEPEEGIECCRKAARELERLKERIK